MQRKSILLVTFLSLIALLGAATFSARAQIAIGATAENFTLPDTNGKNQSLNDLKGEKGTVVVFLSTQCPVVRGYNDRIIKLAADYKAKGINFIGINSNSTESLERIKSHAEETYLFTVKPTKPSPDSKTSPSGSTEGNFMIPVLIDKGNVLADKLGANVTPEIYFFNEKNVLLYHGAIDNDKSGESVTTNYLKDAVDLALAGKPVAKTTAVAFGCTIKRVGED